MSIVLSISYPADLYFDQNLDVPLRAAVNAPCDGRGMGCGFRDISWSFETVEEATAAALRARAVHKRVETSVYELEDV